MSRQYTVTLDVSVYDSAELFRAALTHAMLHDNLTEAHALDVLAPGGDTDVGACLQMLLDPGHVADAGLDIVQSSATCTHCGPPEDEDAIPAGSDIIQSEAK